MYEAAIADCRNCTIGTAPVTEPGQVEALRPWQPGGPRGGGRGGGRGADREGEALKVVEHLEVEDPGLGGALGGAGGRPQWAGSRTWWSQSPPPRAPLLALLRPRGPRPHVVGAWN